MLDDESVAIVRTIDGNTVIPERCTKVHISNRPSLSAILRLISNNPHITTISLSPGKQRTVSRKLEDMVKAIGKNLVYEPTEMYWGLRTDLEEKETEDYGGEESEN